MINLAVIGLGNWGQRHVRSARGSERFEVAMAADPDTSQATPFAEKLNLELVPSIEEVLANPDIDAVTLATPHTLHTEQIIQAAEAGKNIYTEKPFALNAQDARRAISAVEQAGVQLALGHDQRHYPVITELRKMVKDGTFGNILHVETNLSHGSLRKLYQASFENPDTPQPRGWRLREDEAPAGPISQFGIHRVDTFIHLLGEIDWVFASGSAQAVDPTFLDTVSVTFGFKCGATGYLGNSLATPLYSRIQIFGTERWAEAKGPRTFAEYRECSLVNITVYSEEEQKDYSFDIVDSVAINFSSFADSIEGRAPFIIPLEQMIHNIAVVDAIRSSLETGERMTVEPTYNSRHIEGKLSNVLPRPTDR